MKIFITGGSGFIGKHLVRKIQENKNNELFLLQKDLGDMDSWKKEVKAFAPDATIHLAWEGIPDYNWQKSVKNLKYGLDLMGFLAEIGCKKVLMAGSCWEYGGQPGEINEDVFAKPFNAFTAAKNSLHWMAREIAKENEIDFIWTRFFYVYGPGQKEASLIPYLIKCSKRGEIAEIKNPNAKNDFIYVEDLAEALSLLIEKSRGGIYNIGSGGLFSIKEIIEIIYNKDYKKGASEQINSLSDFWADISRIKKETGWEPKTNIKEGIIKTINYYG